MLSRVLHEKSDKSLKRSEDQAKEEVALPSPIAKPYTIQGDDFDDTSTCLLTQVTSRVLSLIKQCLNNNFLKTPK